MWPRPGGTWRRPSRCSPPVPEAPKAVRDAKKAGHAYVVLMGRPFSSGKPKRQGMNLQVIASPEGDVLWVSGALPGSGP